MFKLVELRIIQAKRHLQSIGLLYSLLISVGIFFLVTYLSQGFTNKFGPIIGFVIASLGVLYFHITRSDKSFLMRNFSKWQLNCFFEYLLFIAPLLIVAPFYKNGFIFYSTILSAFIISQIKYSIKISQKNTLPLSFFKHQYFELAGGLREQKYLPVLLWVGSVIFCWIKILPIILLLLFIIAISGIFIYGENLQILRSKNFNAKHFLLNKIKQYLILILAAINIPLIFQLLFFPELLWVILVFQCYVISIMLFSITIKYTTYQPNIALKANSVLVSIIVLLSIMPFMLPIPLLMFIKNYKKSIINLQTYLYA